MRLLRSSQRHEMRLINRKHKKSQTPIITLEFGIYIFLEIKKTYAFLFKAALISIEIAERSIFNFPDIVSIITEVSASSTTLP